MNFILCGMPMSGKTTIGKLLAKQLNFAFIDTDRLIERAYAAEMNQTKSCRELFQELGETKFRELENEQIASLKGVKNSVISIGGGAIEHSENIAVLQSIGSIIYLKAPLNILWQRIGLRGIPAYLDTQNPEETFYELAKKRIPIYENMAQSTIETTDLNEQAVIDLILKRI
jgi:shikimate kinase